MPAGEAWPGSAEEPATCARSAATRSRISMNAPRSPPRQRGRARIAVDDLSRGADVKDALYFGDT